MSFPHRYSERKDIEVAAFIAQWLAYGRRDLFLKVLDKIGCQMGESPYQYIMNGEFEKCNGNDTCLYRFYTLADFYSLCKTLQNIYSEFDSLESVVEKENILSGFTKRFSEVKGIPMDTKSACKRLCMFLRWMVRKNSPVDFGLWNSISPDKLIIPVDVHVFRQSRLLGLTSAVSVSMKTALEITDKLKEVFPSDPLKGDFALFGLGIYSMR